MTNTFVPYKPPQVCVVKINKREASLLQKLRRYPFGEFTVYKANNIIVRLEIKDSQMIDEEGDIDLDD